MDWVHQHVAHGRSTGCSIDPGQQFTWENSNLEVNKPKNRYANVIAYDHSRVILTSIDAPSSAHPDLSPLMEDEEDAANSTHPAWARNWGLALHRGGPTVTSILFWEMEKPFLMVMHYLSSSGGGEGAKQSLTASPAKQQQQL
ncbi:hypothetical protein DV515_00004833 [Chloebia gouldiae]|uniref:Uncharacterized protein n=1 Tax=Chloebia gouldiae TaxID=44316 RepID=A0A3L8SPL9_CHLGU|nr:hypothetical protein DV515_00004833 [Chloebia gouldiae]